MAAEPSAEDEIIPIGEEAPSSGRMKKSGSSDSFGKFKRSPGSHQDLQSLLEDPEGRVEAEASINRVKLATGAGRPVSAGSSPRGLDDREAAMLGSAWQLIQKDAQPHRIFLHAHQNEPIAIGKECG
jgi:hypothetical protein